MSLTTPKLNNVIFAGVISPSILSPLTDTIPVNLPMVFTDVKNLKTFTGTYTPNNDVLVIAQNLTGDISPNFIMIFCDGQLNLTTYGNHVGEGVGVYQLPISKFSFLSFLEDASNYLTKIEIDGRASSAMAPMPQGVAMNYTIVMGQAVIT